MLWLRGDREEALVRAMHALEATLSAAPRPAALGPRPAALLRAAQLASMDAGAVEERAALVLPLLRARRRADRVVTRAVESPAARRTRRVRTAVALWCVLVAAVVVALYRPHGLSARASAALARSEYFGGARAIDGDRKTAWLLPDRETGTLSIELVPPREVHSVRLVQPEPTFRVRETSGARVRLYRGERAIAEKRVSFLTVGAPGQRPVRRAPTNAQAEREVALHGRGVTRVEVLVESWRGVGGGLAEVELR